MQPWSDFLVYVKFATSVWSAAIDHGCMWNECFAAGTGLCAAHACSAPCGAETERDDKNGREVGRERERGGGGGGAALPCTTSKLKTAHVDVDTSDIWLLCILCLHWCVCRISASTGLSFCFDELSLSVNPPSYTALPSDLLCQRLSRWELEVAANASSGRRAILEAEDHPPWAVLVQ